MRHPVSAILSIILASAITFSAAADKPHTLPPPRWQLSLGAEHPQDIHFESIGNVILLYNNGVVIALDSEHGRELWRRNGPAGLQGDITFLPVDRHNPATRVAAQETAAAGGSRSLCELASYGEVVGTGPIAVLREDERVTLPSSTHPGPTEYTVNEVALQVMSGQVLWQNRVDGYYTSPRVVGDLLVDFKPTEAKQNEVVALRYREATTGVSIDPGSPHGNELIQHAAAVQAQGVVLSSTYNTLYQLNIGAGTASRLCPATGRIISCALYSHEMRVLFYSDPDDGGVGHSSWPRFVECADLYGAKAWSFPTDVEFINADNTQTIPELYSISSMTPCPSCGTVLCVNAKTGRSGKFCWYGLDVRDGRILWKNAVVDEPLVAVECGSGFLMVAYGDSATRKPGLVWMDGRNGRLTRIADAPPVSNMFVSGGDLLVLEPGGKLAAYSLATILPKVASR